MTSFWRRASTPLKRMITRQRPEVPGEQDADFYDRTFYADATWTEHYTMSPYYFLWTVIVDRLRRARCRSILELGCGTGQLAHAIRDAGIAQHYLGVDFSAARIGQARKNCPGYRFEIADVFRTDLLESVDYDAVIATEFLEHITRDVAVLGRIREATHVIATVPNFPFVSHVRHFASCLEVEGRYGPFFVDFTVDPFLQNPQGKTFFLLDGIRRSMGTSPVAA